MKKLLCLALALVACFVLLDSKFNFTSVFAQSEDNASKTRNSGLQNSLEKDRSLASKFRQLTNRSADGLIEQAAPGGGVNLDLDDRFQNVMLAQVDTDGEPVAACVTGLDEANHFFGRNLETGESVTRTKFEKTEAAAVAARHGMSEGEYNFYSKLIADAAAQRAANPSAATITIVNADGAGEGFNDATPKTPEGSNNGATLGEQRLNLFNFAASIWGAYLDTNVPINVNSQFNSLTPCTTSGGVLGSAGTTSISRNFPNAPLADTWYHTALASKISGVDRNGATAEINATFNSDVDNGCLGAGSRFYYGLDNASISGRVNLLVVLLHEMGHGLGFSSFVSGTTGTLNGGFPDVYTRYMFDRTTGKYWYQMTDAERLASATNANNVLWDGPNVKIASGFLTSGREAATGRVQLYTPATFAQGSSISHFDTANFPNLLMEPNITSNLPVTLDLTRQEMRDIGWYRDTNADLTADTITNVLPNSGTLAVGTTQRITWTNNGGFSRNVTIDLSTDGGTTYPVIIASNVTNTGSFSFTVPNNVTTQARVRVREYDFVDPVGVSSANFTISTSSTPTTRTRFDFDGDGKSDVSIFRPNTGEWWLLRSIDNQNRTFTFGAASDKMVPADFTGDGKTDVAFWRPNTGEWFVLRSEDFTYFAAPFGQSGDAPAPADFDADGKADLAVFRPSAGTWFINLSAGGSRIVPFGTSGDVPEANDYDGDGRADIAIFRPSTGEWWLSRSTAGQIVYQFGSSTDKPVPADYTGDGKTDVAFFRPAQGFWYILRSENSTYYGAPFGQAGDIPVAADYDGDGRADLAVFRPSDTNWYLNRSTAGFQQVQFGLATDKPVAAAFIP